MLSRVDIVVMVGVLSFAFALMLPGCRKTRGDDTRARHTNNLKQIGLAAYNYHDTYMRFPGNGDGSEGLPSPSTADTGSFFYQILPYVEQDECYRNPDIYVKGEKEKGDKYVRCYRNPRRDLSWRPSCLVDFAVNLSALYGTGIQPTHENRTATLGMAQIADGTSSTILVGEKSIHPSDYNTTNPNIDATFLTRTSGGTSTVCARYTIAAKMKLDDLTQPPGIAWTSPVLVSDPIAIPGQPNDNFGGPFPNGVLFVWVDGHVSAQSYSWANPGATIPVKPIPWGNLGGTITSVGPLRAALTPEGGEAFLQE